MDGISFDVESGTHILSFTEKSERVAHVASAVAQLEPEYDLAVTYPSDGTSPRVEISHARNANYAYFWAKYRQLLKDYSV